MTNNSSKYLDIFRQNGKKIAAIKKELVEFAQFTPPLEEIDKLAEKRIKEVGGEPAFKKVPGYDWTTCISVNSGMVHGVPQGTTKPGDLVTIDVGMYYQGTTTDTAHTFVIGDPSPQQQKFLSVGQKTLKKAIKQAKIGNKVRDISKTMQTGVEKAGYTVSRTLTGHGLGETMHQDPAIPCFVSSDPNLNTTIEENMVLAIEVMYMKGNWQLSLGKDNWTLSTADGSDSAVFEEDVIITQKGPEVITAFTLEPGGKV